MEPLLDNSLEELTSRFSIENATAPTLTSFEQERTSCMKRITETTQLTEKVQQETDTIQSMLQSLREKTEELESAFEKIDQLEIIINKVKDTYNAVAENVNDMERAVSASIPSTLSLPFLTGKRADSPYQPYFPPPKQVEIYNTTELLSSLAL
ncbi:hypothetical protein K501DRAFT_329357 [Backusella circina FSU 941]|nr:hypothetical protein K501DRAFT_329357 [Backusella circina FSU 941]